MRVALIVSIVLLSLNALLNLITAIHSLITDNDEGFWCVSNFLASVAMIIVPTQQL